MKVFQIRGTDRYVQVCHTQERPASCPEHYVCVSDPGGGWLRWRDPNTLDLVEFPTERQEGYARFEDGIFYPCSCNPHHRWNGWACPSFTSSVFAKVCKEADLIIHRERMQEGQKILFGYYGQDDPATMAEEDFICIYLENGMYAFDGWCWDFYTEQEKAAAEAAEHIGLEHRHN